MTLLRFIGFLVAPIFSLLAIPILLTIYVLLFVGMGLYETWLRAKRDPRYDESWWINP